MRRVLLLVVSFFFFACGGDGAPPAGSRDGSVEGPCLRHSDCDDGTFCNGPEACDPEAPSANARGCRPGTPPCALEFCNEARATCEADCVDLDGDGYEDVACGGEDCDDSNDAIHPEATEVCDTVDDDCDPTTVGDVDVDDDGFVDAVCCNGETCGDDCDDSVATVHRTAPEVCDEVDQDCDGSIDEGVTVSAWPDADGDGYGDATAEPVVLCSLPSSSADRGGDCDDTTDLVSPRESERCNGVDDDCDGNVDERMNELCDSLMPPGTIGGCFVPADGGSVGCRALSCDPGYFDCDGSAASGCEQNLCASDFACNRCGRGCSSGGCTGGICVGIEVDALHRVRVTDADDLPLAGAVVSIADTCRSVGGSTGSDGVVSLATLPANHVRVAAAGSAPSFAAFHNSQAGVVLFPEATVDAWYADPDVTLPRDADKGTLVIVVRGAGTVRSAPWIVGAATGPSFRATGTDATPATTAGLGVLVYPNVTPGLVSVRADAGMGCSFLCSDSTSRPTVLVEPGAVTVVVVNDCFQACASM